MTEIEQFEIGAEKFLRDLIVERLVGIVSLFQKPTDGNLHLLEVRLRLERLEGQRAGKERDEKQGR